MKKKHFLLLASIMLVLSVFLAACTGDKEKDKKPAEGTDKKTEEGSDSTAGAPDLPTAVSNTGEAIEDGELTVGLVSDSPFEGTLHPVFYSGNPDWEIMKYFVEPLLAVDGEFRFTNEGAAEFEISEDHKTITLKIKDGVNWHDGEPVKASDLLYSYQILGHPEYTGTRYTDKISRIVGMKDYNAGKTKEISGIQVSEDDKEISITYEEATPSLNFGVWVHPTPRHHVGDIMTGEVTMEELASSDKIRVNPIGFGPYKVKKIVPGESVLYERYDDYWRGKPALKSLVQKVVSSASVVEALKSGEIDLVTKFPADQYENVRQLDNVEILGRMDLSYTYIGFKLGKWDDKKKENVMDPNAKMADKKLRQAMWYAMDNATVGKEIYHGLRWPATSIIIPTFKTFHDATLEAPSYDPEKAKEILDEAGYKDVDGDGFREDPKGNQLVINFASMSGGETAEPLAQYYIQNWEQVGLKVQLLEGRLHEFNSFYDRVEKDDPEIDIYQAAWGTGSDPDPSGAYGRTAKFNYPRYVSEKNDELLAAGVSEKAALDEKYRVDVYKDWQKLMIEDVPVAPTVYRTELVIVNKRVTNYDIDYNSDLFTYQMGVTE